MLVVAIALPFFFFTRAQHLHRIAVRPTASPGVLRSDTSPPTNAPTGVTAPSPSGSTQPPSLPLTAARATAHPRPSAAAARTTTSSPPSVSASIPAATPTPLPEVPPIAILAVTPTSGLGVLADAAGSYDPDNTPVQIFFNFGDGSPAVPASGLTASHTYAAPGTYTVTVSVIDIARNASTASAPVTVT